MRRNEGRRTGFLNQTSQALDKASNTYEGVQAFVAFVGMVPLGGSERSTGLLGLVQSSWMRVKLCLHSHIMIEGNINDKTLECNTRTKELEGL